MSCDNFRGVISKSGVAFVIVITLLSRNGILFLKHPMILYVAGGDCGLFELNHMVNNGEVPIILTAALAHSPPAVRTSLNVTGFTEPVGPSLTASESELDQTFPVLDLEIGQL